MPEAKAQKKPSFQFYPGDWRKDPNLSRVSLEAKGAMIEIMCLAFDCEKRGMLLSGKTPWTIEEIAHAIGGDKSKNVTAIEELLNKKVLKKDKKGVIFSSRMVKDEKLSKVRREAGFKGGNPFLVKHKVNQTSNQNPTPSSSSSSSTSVNTTTKVVVLQADPFFEMFRRATGAHISDDELIAEIGKFKNKYPNVHINQAGALVNTWVSNIGREKPQEKKMVL